MFHRLSANDLFKFVDRDFVESGHMEGYKKRLRRKILEVVGRYKNLTDVGVGFSGGVDSGTLAKTCGKLGMDVKLVTIGFPGSPDLNHARLIASKLGLPLLERLLEVENLEDDLMAICKIIECKSPLELELGLVVLYMSRTCAENRLKYLMTAQGMDELFCGYEKYVEAYKRGGPEEVERTMEEALKAAMEQKRQHDKIAETVGVSKIDPFLEEDFVELALEIPIDLKIFGSEDTLRKRILREVAMELGVPAESVVRPKKAVQYGSWLHKEIERIARRRFPKHRARELGFKGPIEAYVDWLLRKSVSTQYDSETQS